MNHQLCPLWNVGAIQGVRGTGRERIDKGTREKGVFSFHPTFFSLPRDKATMKRISRNILLPLLLSLSLSPRERRKRPRDTQKENSFSNEKLLMAEKEDDHASNSYRSSSNRSNFLLENSLSSNVYFRKRGICVCVCMKE